MERQLLVLIAALTLVGSAAISVLPVDASAQENPSEPTSTADSPRRARLDEPIVLADGLEVLHYWIAPPITGNDNIQVFGELLNSTGTELDAPVIGLAMYDEEGNVLGGMYALPQFHVIPPNRPMPFFGYEYDPGFTEAEIDSVELWPCDAWGDTYHITEYGYGFTGLEVEDIEEVEVSPRHVRIEGKVRNTTDAPANNVRILLVFYDEEGRFVGSEQTYIGVPLPPGKTGRFVLDSYAGGSSIATPLEYINGGEFTYDIWAGRDDQLWGVSC